MEQITPHGADALFTWVLVLHGVVGLAYVALWVRTPIPQQITVVAAVVWLGCVVLPLFLNPLPYLSWAVGVGTAAAIVIAWNAEWPDTTNRPGPMGP